MNKTVPILIISLVSIVLSQELTAQPFVVKKAPNDTLLYVNDNGNVGIGTSTPEKRLHVKATLNEIARFETTAASGNSFLSLGNSTGQFANLGRFNNGTDDYFFLDLDGGGFGEFIVTNSGRVGIGTTSPVANLHVFNGSAGFTPDFAYEFVVESSASTRLLLMSGGDNPGTIGFGSPTTQTQSGFIQYEHIFDRMQFGTSGGGQMYLDSNGSLGIGVAAPVGKLDVNGAIFQRSGLLHADYVFESDYDLESIEEHTDFMWKNKHLKAVPKAKVDENGLEIIETGAHRRGIVEELEKAHIYIDQLYQENKVLAERVAKLDELRTESKMMKEYNKTLEARLVRFEELLHVGQ